LTRSRIGYLRLAHAAGLVCALLLSRRALAQDILRLDLPVGRSFPYRAAEPITRVSIANPDIADVVVISEREVVINARAGGETDAILWLQSGSRLHYRVVVRSPSDRMQIALSVKFAEVRRDMIYNYGASGRYLNGSTRIGTGLLNSDTPLDKTTGALTIPGTSNFLTVLSDFNTKDILAFLQAEESRGRARLLAEPTILAANKDSGYFLAGGELPIPVVQGVGGSSAAGVTVQYKDFGIKLKFLPEIISDSLIKLNIAPEVSSLDFANAITLQGFRIPALRTRRVQTSLDVRRDESLIISGLFDSEEQKSVTGVPFLMHIPILGSLFSSTQWQRNESELIVIVTPVIVDPMHPRPRDTMRFKPDTTRPATDALQKRLPGRP
jgi:Flp pilus assembly secretin CpaC